MSKLGDKIRKARRLESGAIGFGAITARPRVPSMLLMVHGPAEMMRPAGELAERGVDAILQSLSRPQEEMGNLARWAKEAGDVPWGAQVAAASSNTVAGLKEAGADFLAFDAEDTAAEALLETEMGYVLAISGEPADTFLRVLETLPLEGLWLYDWQGPLTVRRQMELRRLHLLSRTPLFVPVQPDIDPAALECLRDAGVVAVAMSCTDASKWQQLADLRQAIDGLPPRPRRREERPEAVLPLGRESAPQAEEEEEEEVFPPE
ncbi:MAG: hypothetical protein AMJ77_03235 [Dehalococcoidia bacterium SM23_28_2]|nr:MAG: hypothetical protein AMJ77_03235 [Dehalococcoidia bacterium SM23_28_2]